MTDPVLELDKLAATIRERRDRAVTADPTIGGLFPRLSDWATDEEQREVARLEDLLHGYTDPKAAAERVRAKRAARLAGGKP